MTTTAPPAGPGTVAGDAVAVGHEIGHLRADGTIIGRAEPYAKVFCSSRQVKRAVGVMAWAILEDIALDARIDHHGRLVAATNVRRIADNLGVSKNTVARHLTRLRDAGFVLHEEGDHDHTGRYTLSRYVLDPSACVERFTHTPSRHEPDDRSGTTEETPDAGGPAEPDPRDDPTPAVTDDDIHSPVGNAETVDAAESPTEDGFRPCTSSWDTADGTVSQSVGHRELGHKNKEEVVVLREQHRAREDTPDARRDDLVAMLEDAGITPAKAPHLASTYRPDRIAEVLDAVTADDVANPPGWITAALTSGWDIHDLATKARDQRRNRRRSADQRAARQAAADAAARHARTQHRCSRGWADLAAELLDDDQLGHLIDHFHDPRFPRSNRSVRLTTAQITGWVAGACCRHPDLEHGLALATALTNPDRIDPPETLPPPPTSNTPRHPLVDRVAALLPLLGEEVERQDALATSMANGDSQAA